MIHFVGHPFGDCAPPEHAVPEQDMTAELVVISVDEHVTLGQRSLDSWGTWRRLGS